MRTILDGELVEWEVWAGPGRSGRPSEGVLVFRCLSDPERRPRTTAVDGGRAAAEKTAHVASSGELQALLADSLPLR
ncbi:MAG: hypothetical protein WD120_02265 [Gemmatimonadota bacterium]